MTVYNYLASGLNEIMNAKKYKSPKTRRLDLCNRYNAAIAAVLESNNLTDMGRATVRGVKGLITSTIVNNLNDNDLKLYVDHFVDPILSDFFGKTEF